VRLDRTTRPKARGSLHQELTRRAIPCSFPHPRLSKAASTPGHAAAQNPRRATTWQDSRPPSTTSISLDPTESGLFLFLFLFGPAELVPSFLPNPSAHERCPSLLPAALHTACQLPLSPPPLPASTAALLWAPSLLSLATTQQQSTSRNSSPLLLGTPPLPSHCTVQSHLFCSARACWSVGQSESGAQPEHRR